jgi:hypothetical protein
MHLVLNSYFKINKQPELLGEEYSRIQSKIISMTRDEFSESRLNEVLDLFHRAFEIDKNRFLLEILFEFQVSKHKICLHKNRIYKEMERIDEFEEGSIDEASYMVNIYRNIVSDLFDPYMSLFVASLKLIDGDFESYLICNLGQGERNKVEFCVSRLKNSCLFKGYNPVVRNAISHSGTDSIEYSGRDVIFRSIKRGVVPKVESVVWSNPYVSTCYQTLPIWDNIDLGLEAG